MKKNVLIATYRSEKNQLDWIRGVNPKRDYMLYNIRRNADLFSNRNGGSCNVGNAGFLILYNYHNLSASPTLYKIVASVEASEQQMINLRYPEPEGTYILFQIEELGIITDINISDFVSKERDYEPILVPINSLNEKCINSLISFSNKAHNSASINLYSEIEKVNKWDKSIPVEENSYYWKGDPIITKGNFVPNGNPVVVELFCGCGGTSVGFEMAGYQIAVGADILKPAIETFRNNHEGVSTILGDIHKVKPEQIMELLNGAQVDVLIGGVPCQGFSLNNRKRHEGDKRNKLYLEFIRFVEALHPRAVVLENVSGMKSTGNIVEVIERDLSQSSGMNVRSQFLYAPDYGVPQSRTRLLFVGVQGQDFDFNNIIKTNGPETDQPYNTVGMAISDLPHLQANGRATEYNHEPENAYQEFMRQGVANNQLTNHQAPNHPADVINMIANTAQGEPLYERYHQRIRLSMNDLSPTQVSGGIRPSFQFGHPTDARGLTIRERCRIQSFPDNFVVSGGIVQGRVQTGNAVPPLLARAVALAIKQYL